MPLRHILLAVMVAFLWGLTFLSINLSLRTFPPFLLVALRFLIIAIPTILFVPRPKVDWRWLVAYGMSFGVMQFAFLYLGMATGMPTGLASLVLQSSAPFTVILGMVVLKEHLSWNRVIGVVIAIAGLGVVGSQRWEGAAFLPFLLTLGGGLGWAIGNVCNRMAKPAEPFRFMLWMTTVPPIPLLALSWVMEGPDAIATAFSSLNTTQGLVAIGGLIYMSYVATVVGSGIWAWLIAHHPAAHVAPFSLLVPVFGMSTAWLVLGEERHVIELLGAAMIVLGVLIGSPSLSRRTRPAPVVAATAASLTPEPHA